MALADSPSLHESKNHVIRVNEELVLALYVIGYEKVEDIVRLFSSSSLILSYFSYYDKDSHLCLVGRIIITDDVKLNKSFPCHTFREL